MEVKERVESDVGDGSRELDLVIRPHGCVVRRDRLLHDLVVQGSKAGISLVCAPEGYGKTMLLTQYISEVRGDAERGVAQYVDASSFGPDTLLRELRRAEEELEPRMRPLLVLDDVPVLGSEAVTVIAGLFRELRGRGIEILVSCKPDNLALIESLGDSFKIGAQTLRIQPQEYARWTEAFAIASSLDVYDMTKGIPALVPLLRTATRRRSGTDLLGKGSAALYRTVLTDLRRMRSPLFRLACLMLFMGKGSMKEFEAARMRVRPAFYEQMAHDYPLFGIDCRAGTFSCLDGEGPACDGVRKEVAKRRPALALKAVQVLLESNRVDRAVYLAEMLLTTEQCLQVIEGAPTRFALSGNAPFVHAIAMRLTGEESLAVPVGVLLAVYLSSLSMGEYRMARTVAVELRRRAGELEGEVGADDWHASLAFSGLWGDCAGIGLPNISIALDRDAAPEPVVLLKEHMRAYGKLVGGDGDADMAACPYPGEGSPANKVDLPALLLECDRLLDAALHGDLASPAETDRRLQDMTETLASRRLLPFAARVRMTAATCRVLSGMPLADERAFADAGTVAIRESDFATQLFCIMGEGWQSIDMGQYVNAQFRAQQVIRLAEGGQSFLIGWAQLLEKVAFILNTSQIGIGDEAETIDLTQDVQTPVEAWLVALQLSAARYDAELAAWYSIHKQTMLDQRFRPLARLALTAVGHRGDAVRGLMPPAAAPCYLLGEEPQPDSGRTFDVAEEQRFPFSIGEVSINLFGGFVAFSNGHALGNDIWRRKRACALAARLTLALGTFVSRQIITQEMWPDLDFLHARENLYGVISSLRAAFGQMDSGPQYLLTQGEGLALNPELVSSDVARFDALARDVLLKRTGTSGRQTVELCLKMEELYTGSLYVPEQGDTTFFLRMRRAYTSKFVDCMLRGIDLAIELDDLHSASWLVEAALKQAPLREDVVRCAMRIYDLSGRRREVVELYNSHLHVLESQVHALPEEETRLLYESIINKSKFSVLL